MLSKRSHSTMMSNTDRSAQSCLKSNTPNERMNEQMNTLLGLQKKFKLEVPTSCFCKSKVNYGVGRTKLVRSHPHSMHY